MLWGTHDPSIPRIYLGPEPHPQAVGGKDDEEDTGEPPRNGRPALHTHPLRPLQLGGVAVFLGCVFLVGCFGCLVWVLGLVFGELRNLNQRKKKPRTAITSILHKRTAH